MPAVIHDFNGTNNGIKMENYIEIMICLLKFIQMELNIGIKMEKYIEIMICLL
jgi:hypothetical protein